MLLTDSVQFVVPPQPPQFTKARCPSGMRICVYLRPDCQIHRTYQKQCKEIYFTEKFKNYVLKAESRPKDEDEN